jgi:NADH-quinone oxidoreductase subunit N
VLLVVSTFGRGLSHRAGALASSLALLVTGLLVAWGSRGGLASQPILGGMFVLDGFALFFKVLILLSLLGVVLLSFRFVEKAGYRPGEYYALLLLAGTGMLLMAGGASLLSIWIALETMALASYVLAGYFKEERRSSEAAFKYFVLGALSSGVLLYGISLLYGATGTVGLAGLARALPITGSSPLAALGWMLLAVGLLFKVAAAPFHVWTPDVYVGAPTPVTAFLAAASKVASFAILARIFGQGLAAVPWQPVVAVVAAASMIWGNVAALTQTNVKRMLAYSSIGHAGYVLVGVVAAGETGRWAVLFYLLAYSLITLGTFAVVILVEDRDAGGQTYAHYAGMARRHPLLAAAMTLFLLALTGIPPTGGFVGKVYLFAAAIQGGWTWLAVIGVLTSALSLYFYFGLVVQMYLREPGPAPPMPPVRTGLVVGVILACAVATLVLGLFPGPFLVGVQHAILSVP